MTFLNNLRKRHLFSRNFRIAAGLIFTIAILALLQRAIGTRGWDFSAGFLTIVMVVLGLWLVAVLLGILRGRTFTDETLDFERSKPLWEKMMEEGLDNDPHVIGSSMYRIEDD